MRELKQESAYWLLGFLMLWLAYYLHGPFSSEWTNGLAGYRA
ncbi:MAG: hypothetical protein U0931_16565 [Vulcanimicrobiota bacterium]